MIQELLGGGSSLLGGSERKISFNGAILEGTPTPCPPTNNITTTTTTTTTTSDQQNLRCPRCDSSNTKFCYYNNYNLTQPRHFCKTCRRYWTKGGALRNVPIGGGCRKNKSTTTTTTPTTSTATAKASSTGKVKTSMTDVIGKSSLGFDHDPNSNPILWASPQNSQLLALLRASSQNPNPNSIMMKEEGAMIGSHMTSSDLSVGSGALNARPISLDPLSQFPVGLCSSIWKNNQNQQPQHHHHNQNQNYFNHHNQNQNQNQHGGVLMGDVQNNGIQELYQTLKSSVNYYSDHTPAAAALSNLVSNTPTSSSSIMEPSPIAASELNYWNPTLSWSNLPTTHGAFP